MDKKALEEKQTAVQQQATALGEDNKKHQDTINTNNAEIYRLDGEFRLINDLLSNLANEKKGKKNG